MGQQMELKSDTPQPGWSEPTAAYDEYLPGLSPYVHYWYDLRAKRQKVRAAPRLDAQDGADLPGQMDESLRRMIERSLA